MKLISYITLVCGALLLMCSIIFDFIGIMGYLATLLGVILIVVGVLINRMLREFFINLIINFF